MKMFSAGEAFATMAALMLGRKNHKPRPPTESEKARAAKRAEINDWNEQVEAKRRSKLERKGKL